MPTKLNILHLIGSGVMGGREKQLYLILRAQSSMPEYKVSVLFQDPAGPNYELISSLKDVSISHLPDADEFSITSMKRCLGMLRRSDVVFLHSPRIAFMMPLMLTRQPLIYRLSGIFTMPLGSLRIGKERSDRAARQAQPGNESAMITADSQGYRAERGERSHEATGKAGDGVTAEGSSAANPQSSIPNPQSNGRIGKITRKFGVRAQRVSRWFLFRRILTRRATVVLVISKFLKQRAMELYGVPDGKLRLIRIGIDPAYEQSRLQAARPVAEADGKFTISVVARLDVRKRIDRLFEAVVPLVKRGIPLQVLIAGDGDQKKKLVALSQSLGIDHVVEFLGEVKNPYDVLVSSDLFVLPSDNEAFSNSVLEAMFAELPVVVFSGGCGASEAITTRVDGFIVADVPELTDLIEEIMTNPDFGRRVGRQSRASLAERGLTFESHTETLNGIMNEALELAQ